MAQASEQGRGAAAQTLKARAQQRGWERSRLRPHLVAASQLRSETGDGDIRRLFHSASALHENFYENVLPPDEIAENLDDVQALLSEMGPLVDAT